MTVAPLLCALLVASHATAGGLAGSYAGTRVGGHEQAAEAASAPTGTSSPRTRWASPCTYGETASDRTKQYNGRVYDAGTGFHDYGARLYWPEIGRFVSADPVLGDPSVPASLNRYSYVHNNPYKYVDPDGREVRLVFHNVAGPWNHGFIKITPDNQAAYQGDPNFANKENGKSYATLGAGPSEGIMNGKLEGAPNRPRDKDLTVKQAGESYLIQPPEGMTEDEFIARMFQLDKNYKDDLRYEKFPSEKNDSYNSNSYAAGLLKASGAKVPKVKQNAPGIDRPVPKEKFEKQR